MPVGVEFPKPLHCFARNLPFVSIYGAFRGHQFDSGCWEFHVVCVILHVSICLLPIRLQANLPRIDGLFAGKDVVPPLKTKGLKQCGVRPFNTWVGWGPLLGGYIRSRRKYAIIHVLTNGHTHNLWSFLPGLSAPKSARPRILQTTILLLTRWRQCPALAGAH